MNSSYVPQALPQNMTKFHMEEFYRILSKISLGVRHFKHKHYLDINVLFVS